MSGTGVATPEATVSAADPEVVPHRGRPRSARADQAIAEATLRLLGEVGFAAMTMAGVAHAAGVSTATLYRRFPSKAELVVGAVQATIDPAEPIDTGSLADDLGAFLSGVATRMGTDRSRLLLSLAGEFLRQPHLADVVRERVTSPVRDQLDQIVARAVGRGEICPLADRDVIAAVVLGPLHYRVLVTGEAVDGDFVSHLVPLAVAAVMAAGNRHDRTPPVGGVW